MFNRFKKAIKNIAPYIINKINVRTLIEGAVWTITGMGLDYLVPYIAGQTVQMFATRASSGELLGVEIGPWGMLAVGGTAYVVRSYVTGARNVTYAPIAQRAFQKSILEYSEKAVHCSIQNRSKHGEDILRLQKGVIAVSSISSLVCTQFLPVIGSTLTSAGLLAWNYGPQFGGGLVVAATACIIYNANAADTIVELRSKALDANNKNFEDLSRIIDNSETIQSCLKEDYELERVSKSLSEVCAVEIKSNEFNSKMVRNQEVFLGLIYVVMSFLAGRATLNGEMSAGGFATLLGLYTEIFTGYSGLGQAVSQTVSGGRDSQIFFDYLAEPSHIPNQFPGVGLTINPGQADIEFKNVCFAYKSNPNTPILKDITCKIPSGLKVGLVGFSGSGKSTIGKLLFRFLDATSGEIFIADKNIAQVDIKALRANIGIIEQNPVLMRGTVLENILYGFSPVKGNPKHIALENVLNAIRLDRKDIEEEEKSAQKARELKEEVKETPPRPRRIEQFARESDEAKLIQTAITAAQQAQLGEYVGEHGLLSMIEERGRNLSGGQIQRFAIARVLVNVENIKIIILDEATSALDTKTEALIQQAIDEIGKENGLTQLWITHHLDNLHNADNILVFEKGRLVQEGTHDQLTKKEGVYANLYAEHHGGSKSKAITPDSNQVNFVYSSGQRFGLFNLGTASRSPQLSVSQDHVIDILKPQSGNEVTDTPSDDVVVWRDPIKKWR